MEYGVPSCTGREEPRLGVLVGAVEGISSTVRRRCAERVGWSSRGLSETFLFPVFSAKPCFLSFSGSRTWVGTGFYDVTCVTCIEVV